MILLACPARPMLEGVAAPTACDVDRAAFVVADVPSCATHAAIAIRAGVDVYRQRGRELQLVAYRG